MGNRCADHVTPLYPQKVALTLPTGSGRSVGIVRSRTKATEFSLVSLVMWTYLTYVSGSNAFLKKIRPNEEYAEAYIWLCVMWRVSYIYHDCFIKSKQLLLNVLCVAPANVVTLSWDVPADTGLLCNRAAMLELDARDTICIASVSIFPWPFQQTT